MDTVWPVPDWFSNYSYHKDARRFGAARIPKIRLHAGCDIYGPKDAVVRVIADGEITRIAPFDGGTHAVEVTHGGSLGVIRYTEIRVLQGLEVGPIEKGKTLGFLKHFKKKNGKLLPIPMLHIEKYKGTLTGPLTARGRAPYQRRADLEDPTRFLDELWAAHQRALAASRAR